MTNKTLSLEFDSTVFKEYSGKVTLFARNTLTDQFQPREQNIYIGLLPEIVQVQQNWEDDWEYELLANYADVQIELLGNAQPIEKANKINLDNEIGDAIDFPSDVFKLDLKDKKVKYNAKRARY